MNTIFLGTDDQKNLVGSKLTKFCSLCRLSVKTRVLVGSVGEIMHKRIVFRNQRLRDHLSRKLGFLSFFVINCILSTIVYVA